MEKLNAKKFNTLEKAQMSTVRGGTDLYNSQIHCTSLTSWVAGGDTSHEITSDNGALISGWSTKGNTLRIN